MRTTLSAILLVSLASAAYADDPPPIDTAAICAKAKSVQLPKPVQPPKADPAATVGADCDAQVLYYGIGRPPDPGAARTCALSQVAAKSDAADDPTQGFSVLATIYANGAGVKRNYDIALAYACRIDGAEAEMDGRIKHLLALKANGPGKDPFDVCDDVTSGRMMGVCARRDSDLAGVKRDARLAALAQTVDASRKAAFAKLRKAETAFVAALADNEVDLSGTARGEMEVAARDAHNDAFVSTLEAALAGKLPASSAFALATSDKALNAAYAKVMALKDTSGLGTVEKAGIKTTQRAWIAYRDAFVAFVKGEPASTLAVATELTKERTQDLAAFTE